ncbi:MAG TPA: CpsB/CapC family capsule biosynthesis tyrosine phosphatase [Flavitalea sp.]|nr:CpsB/CapC family capsule biosynthesis tyrosine phosphatase [Flavitalea sp.]
MFSIFRKKVKANVDLSGIGTDMHSHLLPGIDDGAPDPAMSIELMRGLHSLGYRQLITTPHIMSDMYRNDRASIAAALSVLQRESETAGLISPAAAAEYFMDDYFDLLVEENVPLMTLRDNWVLVEFSFVGAPANLKQKIFNLQIKGYQPVIAHPERYIYFFNNKKWYEELKDAGCLFQVNLLSLAGYYGKVPNDLAQYLIKKKYVDLLGTDLHHLRHLQVLQQSPQLMEGVNTLLDSGMLLNPGL